MPSQAIVARELGKKYVLRQREPSTLLRDQMMAFLRSPLRHLRGHTLETFWALKDVSFVRKGFQVGIKALARDAFNGLDFGFRKDNSLNARARLEFPGRRIRQLDVAVPRSCGSILVDCEWRRI
jgi:hypothetical protein